jgi:hypothetical protein
MIAIFDAQSKVFADLAEDVTLHRDASVPPLIDFDEILTELYTFLPLPSFLFLVLLLLNNIGLRDDLHILSAIIFPKILIYCIPSSSK